MRYKFPFIVVILALLSLIGCNSNGVTSSSGTINIKAGLVYKDGSTQPIARTKLYLLKEDITAKGQRFYYSPSDEQISMYMGEPAKEIGLKESEIKEYVMNTTSTDFEGNAKFENLPLGTYYIVSFTRTSGKYGFAVWNVKVDLKKTTETVFLDQNNTLDSNKY